MPTPFFLKKLYPLHLPLPLIIGKLFSYHHTFLCVPVQNPEPETIKIYSVPGAVSEVTKMGVICPCLVRKGFTLCFRILPLTQCFVVISSSVCSQ